MLYRVRRHFLTALLALGVFLVSTSFMVGCGQGPSPTTTSPTSTTTQTAACPTPAPQATIPQITITAHRYSFDQPPCVPAGLVDITLVNSGPQFHQAGIVRLNDGVTFAQFRSALLQQGPPALTTLATPAGGLDMLDEGLTAEVILNLLPGQYVTLSLFGQQYGDPDYQHGMISPFTVTAPATPSTFPEPQADGEILLKDFTYVLGTLKTGPTIIKVMNAGAQGHELILGRLYQGKTLADVQAYLQQTSFTFPPYEYLGGMSALAVGTSGWMKLNLDAGTYVAYCLVPDPATGQPHVMLGMITTFTVQ